MFIVSINMVAQVPMWLNSDYRLTTYPEQEWFVGFSRYEFTTDPSTTLGYAVNESLAELAKQVKSNALSMTRTKISAFSKGDDYFESESFTNDFMISSDVKLSNLRTESYYDETNKVAYAFSTIKKTDLSNYYIAQVDNALNSLQSTLSQAKNLIDLGNKTKAKSTLSTIQDDIDKTKEYAELYTAVNGTKLDDLRSNSLEKILLEYANVESALAKSVLVFINASLDKDDSSMDFLTGTLSENLSKADYAFASKPADADYVITIKASTRLSSHTDDVWHFFTDANVSVTRTKDNKLIYSSEHSAKGSGLSEFKAKKKSLESTGTLLSTSVKPYLL